MTLRRACTTPFALAVSLAMLACEGSRQSTAVDTGSDTTEGSSDASSSESSASSESSSSSTTGDDSYASSSSSSDDGEVPPHDCQLGEPRFLDAKSALEIVAADFDLDGDLDLVVTTTQASLTHKLCAFANAGDGTFPDGCLIPSLPFQIYRVTAADFDGDGREDLAGLVDSTRDIAVLLTTPSGAFEALPQIDVAGNADSVISADVDEDGDQDLVVGSYFGLDDNRMQILTNDGTGTLVAGPASISSEVLDAGFADFNGDARLDIAYADIPGLRIAFGDDAGGFASDGPLVPGGYAHEITPFDIDRDGDVDLVFDAWDDAVDSGHLLMALNEGDGTFATPIELHEGAPPAVIAYDLDGDGYEDLLASSPCCEDWDGPLHVHNNGDGSFAAAELGPGPHLRDMIRADVDGDGIDDVIATAPSQDQVVIYPVTCA